MLPGSCERGSSRGVESFSMMSKARRIVLGLVVAATLAAFASPAQAVILYRSQWRNKTAPTGTNANSGWQWEGDWGGSFLGTPIAKNYFLTAAHIGGGVNQNITLNGKTYKAIAQYDDPATDLRIYKVSTNFTSWAPLYTGTSEVGKRAMVFGRGTARGTAVTKNGVTKGWKWGSLDGLHSWGENNVSGTYNGGTGYGTLLKFDFNKNGLYNEGALSTGDSAGAVFINDAGKWKLAGINYLVDGPFSLSGTNGSGFNASVYDKGGLYVGGDNAWQFNADTSADIAGNWYATRVSSRQAWIKSVIGTISTSSPESALTLGSVAVPEPASLGIIAIGAVALRRGRRKASAAA